MTESMTLAVFHHCRNYIPVNVLLLRLYYGGIVFTCAIGVACIMISSFFLFLFLQYLVFSVDYVCTSSISSIYFSRIMYPIDRFKGEGRSMIYVDKSIFAILIMMKNTLFTIYHRAEDKKNRREFISDRKKFPESISFWKIDYHALLRIAVNVFSLVFQCGFIKTVSRK